MSICVRERSELGGNLVHLQRLTFSQLLEFTLSSWRRRFMGEGIGPEGEEEAAAAAAAPHPTSPSEFPL